jgi:WD40 repeat protein
MLWPYSYDKLKAEIGQDSKDSRDCLDTLKGHLGRNIWALANSKGMVATGGDDGSIKVWNVDAIVQKKQTDLNFASNCV